MDEEDATHTSGVGTNADVAIEQDLYSIHDMENHLNCIKNRLRILDRLTKEERSPWWRLW